MNIPLVPIAAFRSLSGDELSARLEDLLKQTGVTEIILFSDTAGSQLALVAVGPGRRFERLENAGGVEVEGLRALCALRPGDEAPSGTLSAREKELAQLEESLHARERYVSECEQRIAEVGQALSEREAMVEQREAMLLSKERDFFRRGGDAARQGTETSPGR
jgi:hypothetical protein